MQQQASPLPSPSRPRAQAFGLPPPLVPPTDLPLAPRAFPLAAHREARRVLGHTAPLAWGRMVPGDLRSQSLQPPALSVAGWPAPCCPVAPGQLSAHLHPAADMRAPGGPVRASPPLYPALHQAAPGGSAPPAPCLPAPAEDCSPSSLGQQQPPARGPEPHRVPQGLTARARRASWPGL